MARNRLSEIAMLRQHSPIAIGVGDEASRPDDLQALMDGGCINVLRVDATSIGGITVALPMAAAAVRRGFHVSFHVNPEVHRHCVFVDESADHIEIFPADRPFDCSHRLIEEPAFSDIASGRLTPPERPGSGLRLVTEALDRFAYRHDVKRVTHDG